MYQMLWLGHAYSSLVVRKGLVPPPQLWAQFVSLSENKADPHFCQTILWWDFQMSGGELVLWRGFVFTEKAWISFSREMVLVLTCDHEEADIRIVLHGLEATKRGYDHIVVFCRDTDVLLILLCFFGGADHIVRIIGDTARERRCYPVHSLPYIKTCHKMYTKILCVRIIKPRYGCTLISSVFNHLLVHPSHLVDGYLWTLNWQLHGQHYLQFQKYVLN